VIGMTSQRYTEEQIAQANRVNLLEYARHMGYELSQVSRQAWKIPNLGGLFIHADGTRWNCFSHDSGGGPIQFVMYVQNKTWVEAMKELVGQPEVLQSCNMMCSEYSRNTSSLAADGNHVSITGQPANGAIDTTIQPIREPLLLPPKGDTFKHVFAYLIAHRKLDKDIVYGLVKQGLLYENDKHSCVFVGTDKNGIPRFASVRSTNTQNSSFRADVQNSDKSYSFNIRGSSPQFHVFESPIDLLSYLTLIKRNGISGFQSHMLSLGGVSERSLTRYLRDYPEIKTVTLCLDNDEAGHAAIRSFSNRLRGTVAVNVHLPEKKDWNEDLVVQVEADREQAFSR